jgi:DDE superfamily endonuclease
MLDDRIMKGTLADKIVPIIDNAPCHSGLEIFECEPQYTGLSILRLGQYSAPLNPIEAIWNSVKAVLKAKHADGLKRMLDDVGRGDLTLVEF